jgi:hypothetical protein
MTTTITTIVLAADRRLRTVSHPLAICPGCYAETRRQVPDGTTTQQCPRYLAELRCQLAERRARRRTT